MVKVQKTRKSSIGHQSRHIDQWNRIESQQIVPHINDELIFDNDAKAIQWRNYSHYSKWYKNNWILRCQRQTHHKTKEISENPLFVPYLYHK